MGIRTKGVSLVLLLQSSVSPSLLDGGPFHTCPILIYAYFVCIQSMSSRSSSANTEEVENTSRFLALTSSLQETLGKYQKRGNSKNVIFSINIRYLSSKKAI